MSLISREALILGAPYKLKNICKIYQLTLEEIFLADNCIGIDNYYKYINLLTLEEEDIVEIMEKKGADLRELGDLSVLQYLMSSAEFNNDFLLDFKTALSTFIKEDILISTKTNMIIVGNPKDRRIIGEKEFQEIGIVLRLFNKMRVKEPPPENETPMQRRFRLKRELRDRVKEKQQQKEKTEDGAEFADVISSVCCMGVGIDLLNIGKYTIYQIKSQLERGQAREQYYTELDMLMAGASSKKIKPEYYVRKL